MKEEMVKMELAVGEYAAIYEELNAEIEAVKQEQAEILRKRHDKIMGIAERAAVKKGEVLKMIESSASAFSKPLPRSRETLGIKWGMRKQKGRVIVADPERTIKIIEERFEDDYGLLIQTRKSVNKAVVGKMMASDLKAIGVKIEDDTEAPFCKSAKDETERYVNSFLAECDEAGSG